MLNDMYHLWLQSQVNDQIQEEEEYSQSDNEDEDDDGDSSMNGTQCLAVGTCIATIKETILNRTQYSDSLLTLLTQLDLLMKSPDPCRAHASDLLEIFMLPEFLERDVDSLGRMFGSTDTHPGYISACSLALGLLSESEHLITSSLPTYESYNVKKDISPDQYFNSIALSYYLKSNVLSTQSPTTTHTKDEMTQNSIACMLLGALFLRGGTVDVPSDDMTTKSTKSKVKSTLIPNSQAAFDYYKLAAMGNNPIAQHKYVLFFFICLSFQSWLFL